MRSIELARQLWEILGLSIEELTPVSGGDIADSYLLDAGGERYFLKVLRRAEGFKMLRAEADGLAALGATGALRVPGVVRCAPMAHGGGALLMEYIPSGKGSKRAYERLGHGLARIHQSTSTCFGWEQPNYIGSLAQNNSPEKEWAVFYARHRLMPQYRMAAAAGLFSQAEIPDPGLMVSRISSLLPDIAPSLLHGDLWGGNYLISESGEPCLIDPAVYYGHCEADLAMTLLFGGFPPEFYSAYFEVRPRVAGFDERVALYQLYYLLVHLNLFGHSYYPRVSQITNRIFRA